MVPPLLRAGADHPIVIHWKSFPTTATLLGRLGTVKRHNTLFCVKVPVQIMQ